MLRASPPPPKKGGADAGTGTEAGAGVEAGAGAEAETNNVIASVRPIRGRMLFFPHNHPHEGCPVRIPAGEDSSSLASVLGDGDGLGLREDRRKRKLLLRGEIY